MQPDRAYARYRQIRSSLFGQEVARSGGAPVQDVCSKMLFPVSGGAADAAMTRMTDQADVHF